MERGTPWVKLEYEPYHDKEGDPGGLRDNMEKRRSRDVRITSQISCEHNVEGPSISEHGHPGDEEFLPIKMT